MSGLFSPKMPKMIKPPPTPMVDQAVIDREAQDMARRRRGRAATVLAGDQSQALQTGALASKTLLGA